MFVCKREKMVIPDVSCLATKIIIDARNRRWTGLPSSFLSDQKKNYSFYGRLT